MADENIYEILGEKKIKEVVRSFYNDAVIDCIIGHFFFNKDIERIIKNQVDFSCIMLGDRSRTYSGVKINKAHEKLKIRLAHFNRRQTLLGNTLVKHNIPYDIKEKWMELELKFKDLILKEKYRHK
jgi:truncated hemoglobin YjbI